MKRKIFVITAIILIMCALCSAFVGCKSAEEKEKEYYAKAAANVESATKKLTSLTDEVFSKSWTSSFVLAITHYVQEDEKGNKLEDGKSITRGSKDEAGWQPRMRQYVTAIAFDVDYKQNGDYTVKTTVFEVVKRSDYLSYIAKKNYRSKFTVAAEYEYSYVDGEGSGTIYIDPIQMIKTNTDSETLNKTGIAASDNFRIYTHFMRIESRQAYGQDNQYITREVNDASADESGKKAYWNGYGDDISYNWDNVYAMSSNRLTVLYSKGKNRINSLEIYNESILAYYTKNNNVDTSLVLKADVIAFAEMVIEFKYAK